MFERKLDAVEAAFDKFGPDEWETLSAGLLRKRCFRLIEMYSIRFRLFFNSLLSHILTYYFMMPLKNPALLFCG